MSEPPRPIGKWVSIGAIAVLLLAVPIAAMIRSRPAPYMLPPRPAPVDPRIRYPAWAPQQLPLANGTSRPVHSVLRLPTRMAYGEFVWNDDGVPPGPIWLRVDLRRQLVSVFRGADEIGTSVILYGQDQTPTPTGDFPIRGLEKNHRSSRYDAQMPYTLWLTGDGVAIHGSDVREGLATHGCIGVPLRFAERLFAVAKRGDLVTVLR